MNKASIIGLDLGSHSIKAVQALPRGETIRAHLPRAVPSAPYEFHDFERLGGVLYRQGFRGNRVAVAAPKSSINRLTMDIPPVDSGAPIESIASAEVARQRQVAEGAFEYRWDEAPQPPRHAAGSRAIVSSCLHEDAERILSPLEQAGFDPISLEDPALTVANDNSTSAGTVAAIDLGWTEAMFLSVHRGSVRFARSIAGCGLGSLVGSERWLADSIMTAIGSSVRGKILDERTEGDLSAMSKRFRRSLAEEVASSVQYLEGCGSEEIPSSMLLLGGGSMIPGVGRSIEAATGIPVRTLSPIESLFGIASSTMRRASARENSAGQVLSTKGKAA